MLLLDSSSVRIKNKHLGLFLLFCSHGLDSSSVRIKSSGGSPEERELSG